MGRLSKQYQAVYKSAVDSVRLNTPSEPAELLFYKLLMVGDDYGRYHGDAFEVCARVLTARWKAGTVTPEIVEARLVELERAGSIRRYMVGAERFLEIIDHKSPTADDRRIARFPAPVGAIVAPDGASLAPERADVAPLVPRAGARVWSESESESGVQGESEGEPPRRRGCTLDEHLAEFEFASLRSDVVDAARDWSKTRAEGGLTPWGRRQWRPALRRAMGDPAGFIAAVAHSGDQGYSGLVKPKDGASAPARKTTREAADDDFYTAWDTFMDAQGIPKAPPRCSTPTSPAKPLLGSVTSPTPPRLSPAPRPGTNGSAASMTR